MKELNYFPLIGTYFTQSYICLFCYKAFLSRAKTRSEDEQSFIYFSSLFHEHSFYYNRSPGNWVTQPGYQVETNVLAVSVLFRAKRR